MNSSVPHMQNTEDAGVNPLFATHPIAGEYRPPVIIVGLPRSGSSFLSHVLSQVQNWYVFDDLYLYRHAKGIGAAEGKLTQEQLEKLIFMLGWQVRARINFPKFHVPDIPLDDVDKMDEALRQTYKDRDVTWHELQHEWLMRLAKHHNCENWGYKAPQDFMNLDMLNEVYPDLKVVFLYRDPRKVMASFKNITADNEDGHPGQYHPWVYSQYWKMALSTLKQAKETLANEILEIKFEDLVSEPQVTGDKIAKFLGAEVTGEIEVKKPNSSFSDKKRQGITPTETWICEKIAGSLMREKGYADSDKPARFRIIDIPDLIYICFRFTFYQIIRVIKDPDALVSIRTYMGSLFKKTH